MIPSVTMSSRRWKGKSWCRAGWKCPTRGLGASSAGVPTYLGKSRLAPRTRSWTQQACPSIRTGSTTAARLTLAMPSGRGWWGSPWSRRPPGPVGVRVGQFVGGEAAAPCEVLEGGAYVDAAHLHHQVERGAVVAAAVAVPALFASSASEDRHGRCATGLRMVRAGTRPRG